MTKEDNEEIDVEEDTGHSTGTPSTIKRPELLIYLPDQL